MLLQALLAFLNAESERLVGKHTAITSAAVAAMAAAGGHSISSPDSTTPEVQAHPQQARPGRPGHGLLRAMQRGILGLSSKLQGHDHALSGTGSSQQQADVQAAQLLAQQWLQLSQTCWCPVLMEPPDPALPWRDVSDASSTGANASVVSGVHKGQRFAAPCAMRPLQDLWLASAAKPVVDGECQSRVALNGLGW